MKALNVNKAQGQCVFHCPNCEKFCIMEVQCNIPSPVGDFSSAEHFLLTKKEVTDFLKIIKVYPSPKYIVRYPEVPSNINNTFEEVQRAFNAKAIHLAGAGCRKVLDLIFKDKNIPGNNLFEKIENSELPEIVKDWAHNIRLLGNILIHEDVNFTPEEVEEIFEFTKIIIEYIYVLPTRAKALREKYEKFKTHN